MDSFPESHKIITVPYISSISSTGLTQSGRNCIPIFQTQDYRLLQRSSTKSQLHEALTHHPCYTLVHPKKGETYSNFKNNNNIQSLYMLNTCRCQQIHGFGAYFWAFLGLGFFFPLKEILALQNKLQIFPGDQNHKYRRLCAKIITSHSLICPCMISLKWSGKHLTPIRCTSVLPET